MPDFDQATDLREIPVDRIDRNEENPRVIFRQDELDDLTESIHSYGVLVPVTVYKKKSRYVLIDGERRWLCSLKLNRKTIPAIIHSEPSQLNNLLLMFNIHALREQWDLLTIALKLPSIIELLREELKREPNEAELSLKTGLSRSVIRRARLLADLPQRFKDQLLAELHKPPAQQKLTEDFFIEMERAITTVKRALPEVIPDVNAARDVLIEKYQKDTIKNLVSLRLIPKIARAEKVGADEKSAATALRKLFHKNSYSIDDAFEDTVSEAYSEKAILTRVDGLLTRLETFSHDELDEELKDKLRQLVDVATRLLEDDE